MSFAAESACYNSGVCKPEASPIHELRGSVVWKTLGILETTGLTPALAALDVMAKAAEIRVVQAELNDFLGVCLKFLGETAAVETAIAAGLRVAEQMGGQPVADCIPLPDPRAWAAIESPREFNPLIQQDVVVFPDYQRVSGPVTSQEPAMAATKSYALGLIETQGFTAVFEAIDTACKAANVEVVGKEKLGGGYVTVIIRGDVAAVNAAIAAGQAKVEGLGKLIAAHVIPRPSESILSLLPKS
jgi:microcompartment protein CcmL/EutN